MKIAKEHVAETAFDHLDVIEDEFKWGLWQAGQARCVKASTRDFLRAG